MDLQVRKLKIIQYLVGYLDEAVIENLKYKSLFQDLNSND
jgi:hypothetical protein